MGVINRNPISSAGTHVGIFTHSTFCQIYVPCVLAGEFRMMPDPKKLSVLMSTRCANLVDTGLSTSHQLLRTEGVRVSKCTCMWHYIKSVGNIQRATISFWNAKSWVPFPYPQSEGPLLVMTGVGLVHWASPSSEEKGQKGWQAHGMLLEWYTIRWMVELWNASSSLFQMHWLFCLLAHRCIYSANFMKGHIKCPHAVLWNLGRTE